MVRASPPPPIPSKPSSSDPGSKGARIQIEVLCEYLLREYFNNAAEEVEQVFEAYGNSTRDLYDNIIEQINSSPETMKTKRSYSKINNIFNEYAGTTIEEREFMPPPGVKVFKSIGEVKFNGVFEKHPMLTPAKAPPPLSPETIKRLNRFPPGIDPNDAKGIISPTSPNQQVLMNWPPRPRVWVRVVVGTKSPAM